MKERGYTVCKYGKKLSRGQQVTGADHSVTIPIRCKAPAKAVALMHSHPSGNIQPSVLDRKTSHDFNLPVCIKAGHSIKCYKPKGI